MPICPNVCPQMRQHSSKGVNIKKGGGGGWGPEGVEGAHKPYPMLCCHSTLSWPLAAAKAKDKGCLLALPSKAPRVTWQHLFPSPPLSAAHEEKREKRQDGSPVPVLPPRSGGIPSPRLAPSPIHRDSLGS